jgi:hypothetical protein
MFSTYPDPKLPSFLFTQKGREGHCLVISSVSVPRGTGPALPCEALNGAVAVGPASSPALFVPL